jgi:Pentapeptide repeats (8 copies)
MADFIRADLRGSRFERVDLGGAQLRAVDLTDARFLGVDLSGVVMRGVELRRDRMSTVRQVIEGLTDASLDGETEPVQVPGWPEPRSYPVRDCLLCILDEEWEHRLYAERDLDALEARSG